MVALIVVVLTNYVLILRITEIISYIYSFSTYDNYEELRWLKRMKLDKLRFTCNNDEKIIIVIIIYFRNFQPIKFRVMKIASNKLLMNLYLHLVLYFNKYLHFSALKCLWNGGAN